MPRKRVSAGGESERQKRARMGEDGGEAREEVPEQKKKVPEQTVVRRGDFVELHYTGIARESGQLFDTTDAKEAKARGLYDPKFDYRPVIVCVGAGQLVPGLDAALEGKALGEHTIELEPEAAFGRKDARLIKLVPTAVFARQGIAPFPGLRVAIDGMLGTVVTVTGGRTVVDFNHPLAGKGVSYKVRLLRFVADTVEKLRSLLSRLLDLKPESIAIELVDKERALVRLPEGRELPTEVRERLGERIAELIPEIKRLEFMKVESVKEEKSTAKQQI